MTTSSLAADRTPTVVRLPPWIAVRAPPERSRTVVRLVLWVLLPMAAPPPDDSRLAALPPPFQELAKAPAEGAGCDRSGPHALPAPGQGFSELFSSIRVRDYAKIYAGSTFWWTIGGEGIAPVALSGKGMPDPFLFAAMLTGEFAADPA